MKGLAHRDRVVVPMVDGEGDEMTVKLVKGQVYGEPSDGLVGVSFGKDTPVKFFGEDEVFGLYRYEYDADGNQVAMVALFARGTYGAAD